MPDLRSELKKLESLSFDDAGETQKEPTMPHATTNNASRLTFNFVRDNPGTTRKIAINYLRTQGVPESSSASLLGQFVRQGMFKQDGKNLTVTQQEYTPLKSLYAKKSVTKVTAKKKEAPIMEFTYQAAQPAVTHDTLVKAMLGRMSILQAREMYDELKQIFGG